MTDEGEPDRDAAPETGGVRRRRAARRVRTATRRLVDSAEELAVALGAAATETAGEALSETIVPAATGLARSVGRRRARFRRRRRDILPLPSLHRVHPEARLAPVRELGLFSIPVEEIVGTAVDGPDQRGTDFKPLPAFRSTNWEARWQRLKAASDRLASLPPIDVLKTPEGYWVTDGHNRVAVAKENGQVDVDADVRAVILPGQGPVRPAGPLAPVLVDSAGLQTTRRATHPRRPASPSPLPPSAPATPVPQPGPPPDDDGGADDAADSDDPARPGTS